MTAVIAVPHRDGVGSHLGRTGVNDQLIPPKRSILNQPKPPSLKLWRALIISFSNTMVAAAAKALRSRDSIATKRFRGQFGLVY